MRIAINIIVSIIVVASFSLVAEAQSQKNSIDELQQSVAEAYKAKTLRLLDGKKLINGSLLVVIEHSLMEGKGQYVRRRFKTFAQLDEWLNK